jgi:purine-binding chemotaxis protein CheW
MSVKDFVTLRVGGQLFGVDAARVHDVFHPRGLTPVPLSRPEISGVLNLRGRIVTAVCARSRLGLPPREADAPSPLAIGIEVHGDSYGLIIDSVDEVLKLDDETFRMPPGNLPPRWADIIVGVYQLDKEILIILETNRLLDGSYAKAA